MVKKRQNFGLEVDQMLIRYLSDRESDPLLVNLHSIVFMFGFTLFHSEFLLKIPNQPEYTKYSKSLNSAQKYPKSITNRTMHMQVLSFALFKS